MAKSIELSTGLKFKSISEASAYFRKLLDAHELKAPFTGEVAAHIRAAYEAYCIRTNWPVSSPSASFYPTYERGPGYTTRCFGVTFEDGTTDTFSMPKALSAIAR